MLKRLAAFAFWLAVWQLLSMVTTFPVFLASPVQTLCALFHQLPTASFWSAVLFSVEHILAGFFLALMLGICLAVAGGRYHWIDVLFGPLMRLIRTVPVASFIILALLLLSSGSLSVLIVLLMGLPVIYESLVG